MAITGDETTLGSMPLTGVLQTRDGVFQVSHGNDIWVIDPAWTMPDWLEFYSDMIGGTGDESVESIMRDADPDTNRHTSPDRRLQCTVVAQQISLLDSLWRAGFLLPLKKAPF